MSGGGRLGAGVHFQDTGRDLAYRVSGGSVMDAELVAILLALGEIESSIPPGGAGCGHLLRLHVRPPEHCIRRGHLHVSGDKHFGPVDPAVQSRREGGPAVGPRPCGHSGK